VFSDYEIGDGWQEEYTDFTQLHHEQQMDEQRRAFEDQLRRVMDCLYGKIEFSLLESELEDLCGLAELKYPECELMVQQKHRTHSFSKVLLESFSNPLDRKSV